MYRVIYRYEGRDCMTGSMPYSRAKGLVDKGHGHTIITANSMEIAVYTAKQGDKHALRA